MLGYNDLKLARQKGNLLSFLYQSLFFIVDINEEIEAHDIFLQSFNAEYSCHVL